MDIVKTLKALIPLLVFINTSFSQITVTLQPDSIDGKDVKLNNFNLYVPGKAKEFIANAWTKYGDPLYARSLIDFNLSFIHEGSRILGATIHLYSTTPLPSGNHSGKNTAILQRIVTSWEEDNITWETQPQTTEINQVTFPRSVEYNDDYIINVTELVQDMVNDPENSHGFLFRQETEEFYRRMNFASSDYPDPTKHPKITITYLEAPFDEICVTVQPDSIEGKDVKINSLNLYNPAVAKEFIATSWTYGSVWGQARGIIDFDLISNIPEYAIIRYSNLHLFTANPLPSNNHSCLGGNNTALLQRVVTYWDEYTVDWYNQPQTTTENQIIIDASITPMQDYIINVTDLVNDMYKHPDNSYGFFFKQNIENDYRRMNFASSDYPDSTKHPMLTICYFSTVNTPESHTHKPCLNISPNPSDHEINIGNINGEKIEIYNQIGIKIFEKALMTDHLSIDISDFPSGTYFVRTLENNRKRNYSKFIKF